jgi:hypothetical protein
MGVAAPMSLRQRECKMDRYLYKVTGILSNPTIGKQVSLVKHIVAPDVEEALRKYRRTVTAYSIVSIHEVLPITHVNEV